MLELILQSKRMCQWGKNNIKVSRIKNVLIYKNKKCFYLYHSNILRHFLDSMG